MALKRVEKESPLKTRVSGEKFCVFAINSIKRMAAKEKRKAIEETAYGLKEFQLELLFVATFPPLNRMIATFAPSTDAFEIPKVAGDAIGLFRHICMISPDIDNPIPHKIAANTRGSLMFCMILMLILSPTPNKA